MLAREHGPVENSEAQSDPMSKVLAIIGMNYKRRRIKENFAAHPYSPHTLDRIRLETNVARGWPAFVRACMPLTTPIKTQGDCYH